MTYVEHEEHGGGCCGMSHVFGFYTDQWSGTPQDKQLKQLWDSVDRAIKSKQSSTPDRVGYLVEAVLNENQKDTYEKGLLERGFNPVSKFRNANSGNVCTVYHLITGGKVK